MTTDTRTSVMLVDDHSIMRDLLRDALENTGEFQVVAQAADGEEAVRVVQEAAPDVIVMDVIMPVMDGIEACREIMELLPGTRVLMLTASNEKDAIVRSIAAGATGYLQKYSGKEQLLATLRDVAQGEFRIPGDAARRLARAVRSPSAGDASELVGTLTDREKAILKLFAQGLSYQEIGEIRTNSALTVRNAVSAVQKKLGFKTRQQMVVWAVRVGLVDDGSSVILVSRVPERNKSYIPYCMAGGCPLIWQGGIGPVPSRFGRGNGRLQLPRPVRRPAPAGRGRQP